ncbi:uncharacterized protein [Chelonus insularis]|uniref:uncharacterized protein n=1 Tax=Chelonus insularis TaxID=460826 RepID=UPI00158E84AD|nr:uncharacterized protein LOC118067572 [Chelonus insularis]XP_034940278.1 uncharacterized protein LOC118067572 [Chelonus insularis]XP_034940279.1 uncharacterized protein LOC118067572 [Chelonus insularis]
MTLHWWMHWFWVTVEITVILATPLPSTTEDSKIEQNTSIIWKSITLRIASTPERLNPAAPTKASMRIAKAIDTYQPPVKGNIVGIADPPMFRPSVNASKVLKNSHQSIRFNQDTNSSRKFNPILQTTNVFWSGRSEVQREEQDDNYRTFEQFNQRRKGAIFYIYTTSKTPAKRREEDVEKFSSFSRDEENDLNVLPLKVEERKFKVVVNRTQVTKDMDEGSLSTKTFNTSEDIEIDQELAEPRVSAATAGPSLHVDLAESRLSRARNPLSNDNRAQDRSFQDDEVDIMSRESFVGSVSAESVKPTALEIAAITGSCLAMVLFLSAIGSLGFVMYRRKYCNPPQTLNSDKCSNPDSSGYIDDSTIRDNSEEMYSLDNDSFLNSLEAMTIQNYWTDSVKHTKL